MKIYLCVRIVRLMPDNIIPPYAPPPVLARRAVRATPQDAAAEAAEVFVAFMRENGFPDLTLSPEGAMKPLEGGTCSANWRIATSDGAFVMSIAEKPIQRMSPKDVRHFEKYLFKHDISLAEPIGAIGIMPDEACYFQINRFVKGVPFDGLPERTLSQNQLDRLGAELAKIHIWGERFHAKYPCELLRVPTADRVNFVLENRRNDTCRGLHLLKGRSGRGN